MKKILCALIILLLWAFPLSAETYHSPFGFSIDIPSHWLIISSKEIKDNPDLFTFEHEMFNNYNKDMLSQMKNMVVSGQVEIYLNKQTSNSFNNDNINVIKTIERLPQTVSELNQYCAKISQNLSENYGKLIKSYECEFKEVADLNSLYSIFDGVLDGTKSIIYQFQKSPSVAITMTATCRNETFETIRKEFDEIMASFTLNGIQVTNNSEVGMEKVTESEEELNPSEPQAEKKLREFNYDDGSKYIGDIVNGKRHGQGTYIWPDGRKYVGAFENNRATGGWLFETIDKKAWVYQDTDGKWIIKGQ